MMEYRWLKSVAQAAASRQMDGDGHARLRIAPAAWLLCNISQRETSAQAVGKGRLRLPMGAPLWNPKVMEGGCNSGFGARILRLAIAQRPLREKIQSRGKKRGAGPDSASNGMARGDI